MKEKRQWLQRRAARKAEQRKAELGRAARKAELGRAAQRRAGAKSLADLETPLKLLDKVSAHWHELFIKQTSRSNYCGVYSTGMLLSLLGTTTTRNQALALFNLKRNNPDYLGASHNDIENVLAKTTEIENWRWKYYKQFYFASVSKSIRTQIKVNGQPTLLSFEAIHKNGIWRCTHVAVAVAAFNEAIALLDPLGSNPSVGNPVNVWLLASEDKFKRIKVIGNSYSIDHKSEAAVLQWGR